MPGGLRPPLEVIATWDFNYVDPVRGGGYVVITTAIFLALTYLVVTLRLFARFRLAKSSGVDDALIVAGMVPLTAMAVAVCLGITTYGMDRHVWNDEAFELVNARKITMATENLYMMTTCITKVSILLFYRRLAAGTVTPMFQWMIWASIAFVVAYFVAFFTNSFLVCTPLNSSWLQADFAWLTLHRDDFHCQNEAAVLVSSAAISALQDMLACFLPMILLSKLQIPKRQKYALGAIFSVGVFLCICAVLRCFAIFRLYYSTYDMTWESQPAWLWLSIEAHLAVVCASAPALKTFFKHALKDYTYGFRRSGGKSSGSDPSSKENGRSGIGGFGSSRGRSVDVTGGASIVAGPSFGGGRRGGSVTALPRFSSKGAKSSSIPWQIRVDSEHELVYTEGKIPSPERDEFHYGVRF